MSNGARMGSSLSIGRTGASALQLHGRLPPIILFMQGDRSMTRKASFALFFLGLCLSQPAIADASLDSTCNNAAGPTDESSAPSDTYRLKVPPG